ncbi:MAG: hypothetical protein K6E27_10215 [Eubacterium sp.]|nr:hypothetical protein [Eubacterium sp.]
MSKVKMSKKKMFIFGGLGIGALVVLAGVVFVASIFMSPKKKIYKALMNTYGGNEIAILEEYGQKGGTIKADADISGSSGSINVKFKETTDPSEQKKGGTVELSQNNKSVLNADYVMEEDGAYLSVDGVTDGYVKFENAGNTGNAEKAKRSDNGQKRNGGQVAGIIERLWRNAEVEDAGTGSVSAGVKKYNCKKYKVVVKASDINSMLNEMSEAKQSEGGNGDKSVKGSNSQNAVKEGSRPSSVLQLMQELFNAASADGMQGNAGNTNMMPGQGGSFDTMPGMDDSYGFGMMPGMDGSDSYGMMPGQENGQGGQMPGQGNGQQSELIDIRSLMEAGVDEDVTFTFYMDKSSVRAFVADISFGDSDGTDIKIASKNKGVDKVASSSEWSVSLASATDEIYAYFDVTSIDEELEASVEANLSKSGQQVLAGKGDITVNLDIDKNELNKVSNVISMDDVDSNELSVAKQNVMTALSVLRDGQSQSPMMGGSNDSYGGSFGPGFGQGGQGGFGQGGQGGFGMGPGGQGGPGQGGPGMGPGMMPGMGPN